MMLHAIVFATISVMAPNGAEVCRVKPPDCGADAVVETTNLTGGVAWRIRYADTPRTVANEEWAFDFGRDFK